MSTDDKEIKKLAISALDMILRNDAPRWKPERDEKHILKRIKKRHLSESTTLQEYNEVIMSILKGNENELYFYYLDHFSQRCFVVGDGKWIVMFGENGVMETSFPPDVYKIYLSPDDGYQYLGTIAEVRNEL